MITPTGIKQKAERLYEVFLTSIVIQAPFFPRDFPVGRIPKDFLERGKAIEQLKAHSKDVLGYGYALELESRKIHKQGLQSRPSRIAIETEDDYLKLLKKEQEIAQFKENIQLIRTQVPELENWIEQNPVKVVTYSDIWLDLLKVCKYFQRNPQPNLYIRELPIEIHTKFIEQNKFILRSLLEDLLPAEQLVLVESEKSDVFEKRFSLKFNEPRIRFRFLDAAIQKQRGFPAADISLSISDFEQLDLAPYRCFMTENKMNFLTLPSLAESFAIFGSGYAVQALKSTVWLHQCPIVYWGDLDAHGFEILSQLRSYFPQVQSVMMDRKTFEAFQVFSVRGVKAIAKDLPNLTPEEQALYANLVVHQQRLEQEHISQKYANRLLKSLGFASSGRSDLSERVDALLWQDS